MPASIRSSSSNRKEACRFDATSPALTLRLPFFAIPARSLERRRVQVDAPARRLDAPDGDADGISEADRPPRPRAVQDRALLVELPPVAPQPAHGQQSLVAVAERDERARRDQRHDLSVELPLPAGLEE